MVNKNNKNCPVCDGKGFIILDRARVCVCKCSNCGLEYVVPMPNKKQLKEFYSHYINFRAEDLVVEKNAKRNIKILSKYGLTKNNKLLDFGCGKNIFAQLGNSKNWYGYDGYAEGTDQRIKNYQDEIWDFITMWGVLEHLVNPKKTVGSLAKNLKKGGIIALTTVTIESNIPIQYKPPEHVTYWTKKAIERLFLPLKLKLLEYKPYIMMQYSDVYLRCVLKTVPDKYKKEIFHKLPKQILVPTNEIFVVVKK